MIGLGSYAFFWQHSDRVGHPLTLIGALEATRDLDVDLFQICDFAPLDTMSDAELRDAAGAARDLRIRIQLGTKGVDAARLTRFLRLAEVFDARLVRTMLAGSDANSTVQEAERSLAASLPDYVAAGVTLALETYEQIATAELVALVERIDSERLGICLDPANVVARLEHPRTAVETAAERTVNVHVKDFAFARQEGWVGFTYSGVRMGEGLHDYRHLLDTVQPRTRGIDEIVEHWLPWQGDLETTVRTEQEWTRAALHHLRSTAP